jgi:hypothetical protein
MNGVDKKCMENFVWKTISRRKMIILKCTMHMKMKFGVTYRAENILPS